MSAPTELVQQFCDEWGKGSGVDAILGYFTDDAVYHNIPVDPLTGKDAIRNMIGMFTTGVDKIEFQMRHIAASGDVVMTERLDVFTYPDKVVSLPVMGTFEVKDGKIAAWRDYFDLQQYMAQVGA
jgi:limonene-1,2-epoxide hydrolase